MYSQMLHSLLKPGVHAIFCSEYVAPYCVSVHKLISFAMLFLVQEVTHWEAVV